MSPRIALVSWILPVAALLCFRALVPQPSPSIYSTGTEVSAWWLLQAIIFLGALAPARWLQSALLTGSLGLRIALTLLRLAWKTRIGVYTLVASVVGLVVTTYFAVFRLEIAPYSVQLMFTLVMVNLVALLQPPVVLVLTGSERTLFVERICELVFPHRVVALLSNRTIGMTMWFTKRADNLRTLPPADWRETVMRLAEVAPHIIVDTTVPRDSLKFETGLMLEPSRASKAVFVIGDHGESPALDEHRHQLAAAGPILKVTIKELPGVLHDLGLARKEGQQPERRQWNGRP